MNDNSRMTGLEFSLQLSIIHRQLLRLMDEAVYIRPEAVGKLRWAARLMRVAV